MTEYHVTATPAYDTNWKSIWHYRLRGYIGSGSSSVIESNETWPTREEAQSVCQRANAGDRAGLTFALYADD
jgi:hypothetical protein